MQQDQVKDAMEWFELLSHPENLWSFNKMYYVFTLLDEDYDFSDCDIYPLKQIMLKHRDQIQAEVDSVTFIKHHRKENNIPQKYFWWFLDIFEYISDLPDPDYTALDDALKTPAPLKDRKRLCTTGDLFELFFKLDGIDLSDCDTKQIKENLIAIYVRIMNPCFTIEDIKRYRYKKSIPKSRFWWWLDLLIEPKYRHK